MQIRRTAAALTSAAALSITGVAMATPAQAQPAQTGLVNVSLENVLNDLTIQVPVAAAANLCDIEVQVLVADLADDGEANCTATADSRADN